MSDLASSSQGSDHDAPPGKLDGQFKKLNLSYYPCLNCRDVLRCLTQYVTTKTFLLALLFLDVDTNYRKISYTYLWVPWCFLQFYVLLFLQAFLDVNIFCHILINYTLEFMLVLWCFVSTIPATYSLR